MQYNKYTCKENDRIDLIVFKHYGTIDTLNNVLSENTHIINNSMNIEFGTILKLPIFKVLTTKKIKKRTPLW